MDTWIFVMKGKRCFNAKTWHTQKIACNHFKPSSFIKKKAPANASYPQTIRHTMSCGRVISLFASLGEKIIEQQYPGFLSLRNLTFENTAPVLPYFE